MFAFLALMTWVVVEDSGRCPPPSSSGRRTDRDLIDTFLVGLRGEVQKIHDQLQSKEFTSIEGATQYLRATMNTFLASGAYHTVKGVKIYRLVVGPGAAHGLIGSDTLLGGQEPEGGGRDSATSID